MACQTSSARVVFNMRRSLTQSQKLLAGSSKSYATSSSKTSSYPLYPSVILLMHANGLKESDAAKMTASGPNGRLLKGDVLAYLGSIDSSYPKTQSDRLQRLSRLDLSNIRVAAEKAKPSPKLKDQARTTLPSLAKVRVEISLQQAEAVRARLRSALHIDIPITTLISRAVDASNASLPLPAGASPTADELFDQVVGKPTSNAKKTSRGNYRPQISPLSTGSHHLVVKSRTRDIIDLLSSPSVQYSPDQPQKKVTELVNDKLVNVFSLNVQGAEEKRAKTFLERMKTALQVDPEKLALNLSSSSGPSPGL